jgi:hypothetical protein
MAIRYRHTTSGSAASGRQATRATVNRHYATQRWHHRNSERARARGESVEPPRTVQGQGRAGVPKPWTLDYQATYWSSKAQTYLDTGASVALGCGAMALCATSGFGCREISSAMTDSVSSILADPGAALHGALLGAAQTVTDMGSSDPARRAAADASAEITIGSFALPFLGGAKTAASPVIDVAGTAGREATAGTADAVTTWFRAVSAGERADIQTIGSLRSVARGYEGKLLGDFSRGCGAIRKDQRPIDTRRQSVPYRSSGRYGSDPWWRRAPNPR